MDLVQWLNVQLDIDTARATAAAEEDGPNWHYDGRAVITHRERDLVAVGSQDFIDRERGEHIAEHDPARVLREIDAKRQMLAAWSRGAPTGVIDVKYARGYANALSEAVRVIALSYVGRPGYREEWRP
ncbi:DUF6221 family protein [Streptomyces sp. STR69]|uniref:DUF6221 family protein n=1 Tax=Streptomyces sp. STR69 TaxID=1796942 RepID=UPI0021C87324|nr:DUF6221 family protein [Streptomyces sp. STR69]